MAKVEVFKDGSEEFDKRAFELIESAACEAIKNHGAFFLGLSGGSLASILGKLEFPETAEMGRWHVFLVDERAVPLDHSDSNYRAIREAWPQSLKCNWYPVEFGANELAEAANLYEQKIRQVFGEFNVSEIRFDLLLLGLGPDGHTASLFPSHPDFLNNLSSDKIVIPVENSPKPPALRVSLSPKAIIDAKMSAFLIKSSSGKAAVIKSIVVDRDEMFPPTLVSPEAIWILDESSAGNLNL